MSHYDDERVKYSDNIEAVFNNVISVENPSPLEIRVKELEERIRKLELEFGD